MTEYDIEYELQYMEKEYEDDIEYYQMDILKVFGNQEEYEDETINRIQSKIYEEIFSKRGEKEKRLERIIKELANHYLTEDLSFGFVVLFSYDYFYITHEMIKEYYKNNGEIEEKYLYILEEKIIKK